MDTALDAVDLAAQQRGGHATLPWTALPLVAAALAVVAVGKRRASPGRRGA